MASELSHRLEKAYTMRANARGLVVICPACSSRRAIPIAPQAIAYKSTTLAAKCKRSETIHSCQTCNGVKVSHFLLEAGCASAISIVQLLRHSQTYSHSSTKHFCNVLRDFETLSLLEVFYAEVTMVVSEKVRHVKSQIKCSRNIQSSLLPFL